MMHSMFHSKDGIWFESDIGFPESGHGENGVVQRAFSIKMHITEPFQIDYIEDGLVRSRKLQRVIRSVDIGPHLLASIFATMSVNGETAETYKAALDFLRAEPSKSAR